MVKKEFGRYSSDDLRTLVELLRALKPEFVEFRRLVELEPERLTEHLTPPFYWANYYQILFRELLKAQLVLLDVVPQFQAIAQEPDPGEALRRELPNLEAGVDVDPSNLQYMLGIQMALQGNIRSIGFYSKSLVELTKEVEQKNDKAFFDAVLIDRTILACPPFADRMALAAYQGDEEFFKTLAKRLSKDLPAKRMKPHVPLRMCLYELEQEGYLESLSEKRAYELFCQDLKLYPDDVEGNASRNLKRFIQRWRAERAT